MIQHKQVVLSTGARFDEGIDSTALFIRSEVVYLLHELQLSQKIIREGTHVEVQSSSALSRNACLARLIAIYLKGFKID